MRWHLWKDYANPSTGGESVVNDNLESWWGSTRKLIRKETRRAFDSLVILVCWHLWKQRNARVFHPATPSISASELVSRILDELHTWATAGAVAELGRKSWAGHLKGEHKYRVCNWVGTI